MAILDFCTGVSQAIQSESTNTSETTSSDYLLETLSVYGTSTSEVARTWNLSAQLPSDFWFSFCIDNMPGSFFGYDLMYLYAGDVNVMYINANSSEELEFYLYNGTDYDLVGTTTETLPSGTLARFDLNIDAVNGSIDFYVDRSLSLSMSSLDLSYVDSSVDRIEFSYLNTGTAESASTRFTGMFFADEDSTLLTMVQSQVTGDGTYSQLDGDYTDVQCVGKTGDNTSLMSDSNGQKSSFTLQDRSGEISSGTIAAVGVYCRINQDNSANDQARMFLANGSGEVYTDYFTVDQYITPHRLLITADESGDAFDLSTVYNYEVGIEVSENG